MELREQRDVETDVYQPAEDSQLLASTACERIAGDELVLEVGTGSGYVARTVAEETDARVIAADLNPHAVRQAREEGLETVRADLVSPFADGAFDAVLFNPPYLPTDPDNEWDDWMEAALSGGEDGRAVIDPFLEAVGRVLAPGGVVYLLVSSLTGVDEVVEQAGKAGFSAVALADESFPFETLTVLELLR
ncbi:HemK2/MTQ2 family protein methyltransferase [Natronobacterium gregoryi]|uniref:Methyltransferase n=1 Tax=Natronobacterium gregoryi (strain ATCC 43098 / DSM 3393 / CCM 3738 / CIP 104747 / IAM 13177 / JCM 8860 / NBRC 102187 / NCIMB 2189 / SP2) TaxID=797304 RepID=L9YJN1_NATGS|nr:HemK2/MTQ2 family protein methyltransferase [Natronobacterium gregoryi]ELY73886.1 methyltransferase [Natronobacterium gregoryi SP2]PLK19887.1 methyltransferase domain-containing protein [Natronobacterium gregoryi SP2]